MHHSGLMHHLSGRLTTLITGADAHPLCVACDSGWIEGRLLARSPESVCLAADNSRRAFYREFVKVVDAADVVIQVRPHLRTCIGPPLIKSSLLSAAQQ